MMNLLINNNDEELFLSIRKENSILLLDKKSMFGFYYLFYELLRNKKKEIQIKIGERQIDSKNTILLSLCDYTEILENFTFKKGSLFYEYLISLTNNSNYLDNDVLFYDLATIIKNLALESEIEFDYDINEDLEKMIFSFVEFSLSYDYQKLSDILKRLVKSYIEKNISKTFLLFYDSSLLELDFQDIDHCYSFDISEKKNLEEYNLICEKEIKELNLESILEKVEAIWPVEFNKMEVITKIRKYLLLKKINIPYEVYDENELLVYKILDKMREENNEIIIHNFTIRDNVKSFLEQL